MYRLYYFSLCYLLAHSLAINYEKKELNFKHMTKILRAQKNLENNEKLAWIRNRYLPIAFDTQYQQQFDTVSEIIASLTRGSMSGQAFDYLANITDTFGNRMVGTAELENAINFNVNYLQAQGFDNVYAEDAPNLPNWKRGAESCELLMPRRMSMAVLAVGLTTGGNVTADAIVVRSFDELDRAAMAGKVLGKIVVYNEPWVNYGTTVAYRSGAKQAAKYGALASLIRSVTPFSVYSPHTGMGNGDIPSACITIEDAEMLWRMQQRGERIRISLSLGGVMQGTTTSRNTVFQITGTTYPNEVIVLSGHFDSWDVGQGAMDDGGGVAIAWAAITAIQRLGLKPKRTIRGVLWTAEEEGHLGSHIYYKNHPGNGLDGSEKFIFVSESDMGAFQPKSWNAAMQFYGNDTQQIEFNRILSMINLNGIPIVNKPSPANAMGDVIWWASNENIPSAQYVNMDMYDYYFYFHHTNADYMTIFKKEDLDYVAAVYAAIAWLISENGI